MKYTSEFLRKPPPKRKPDHKPVHPGPDCNCDWCNMTDGAPVR